MSKLTGKPKKRQTEDDPEDETKVKRRQAPGRTFEARESQIINKAYDLVEKRIDRGTATSQETTHFLKMGSTLGQLEKTKLENENLLLKAKAESLTSAKEIKAMYKDAMKAFGIYSGQEVDNDSDD